MWITLRDWANFASRYCSVAKWLEFKNRPEDIGIKDIKQDLKPVSKVANEIDNFNDIAKILICASDYVKDSCAAYNIMQQRMERPPLSAGEFTALDFNIHKCRLLISTINEEYRIYEDSVGTKQIRSNEPENFIERKSEKSVFKRLSVGSTSAKNLIDAQKDSDEGKDFENAITKNLHKILPQKDSSHLLAIFHKK